MNKFLVALCAMGSYWPLLLYVALTIPIRNYMHGVPVTTIDYVFMAVLVVESFVGFVALVMPILLIDNLNARPVSLSSLEHGHFNIAHILPYSLLFLLNTSGIPLYVFVFFLIYILASLQNPGQIFLSNPFLSLLGWKSYKASVNNNGFVLLSRINAVTDQTYKITWLDPTLAILIGSA